MVNGVTVMTYNLLKSFNTLAFLKRLMKAGVSEEQAEVFAEVEKEQFDSIKDALNAMEDTLATKYELQKEIKESELRLKKDMKESELRLTLRLGILMTVGVGAVAALVKLL